jgi:hypothetical protein
MRKLRRHASNEPKSCDLYTKALLLKRPQSRICEKEEGSQANPSLIPAVHFDAAADRNPMSDWVVMNWQPFLIRSI